MWIDSSQPRLSGPVAHGKTRHPRPGGQLFPTLLTVTMYQATESDVGLMVLTVNAPAGGDRLLTLHSVQWPARRLLPLWVVEGRADRSQR